MQLIAYEVNPFKWDNETESIQIFRTEFSARENKHQFFSNEMRLPISAELTKGGWYIDKEDLGKRVFKVSGCVYRLISSKNIDDCKIKLLFAEKIAEDIKESERLLEIQKAIYLNFTNI